MKRFYWIVWLVPLIWISGSLWGQVLETSAIIPPSPEASSIAKFSEIPVGHYTGTPNISIPLYELAGKSLSLPIGLKYHAGGIKVEEIASRAGLGWSLFAGGLISRSVRGLADEELSFGGSGYLNHGKDLIGTITNPDVSVREDAYQDIIDKELDFEPDAFSLNTSNVSSRFFIEQTTQDCHLIPYANWDIQFNTSLISQTIGTYISDWVVKDDQGNTYYFGKSKDGTREAIELTYTFGRSTGYDASQPGTFIVPSAWHLMDIESADGDMIHFEYEEHGSSYCLRTSANRYQLYAYTESDVIADKPTDHENWRSIEHKGYSIQRIWNQRFEAVFETDVQERLDVPSGASGCIDPSGTNCPTLPTNKALKYLTINSSSGDLIKKYAFHTSYFSTSYIPPAWEPTFCHDQAGRGYRLRLDRVQDITDPVNPLPPHEFVYNSTKLPHRLSYDQDHWGYYNAAGNQTHVPSLTYNSPLGPFILPGGNRTSQETASKACALETIIYPTGGRTSFEFENHQYTAVANHLDVSIDPLTPGITQFAGTVSAQDALNNQPQEDILTLTINGPVVPSLGQAGKFIQIDIFSANACDPSLIMNDPPDYACGVSLTLGLSGSPSADNVLISNQNGGYESVIKFLPNGTHDLRLIVLNPTDAGNSDIFASVKLSPDPSPQPCIKQAGGLRIKRMISSSDDGSSPDLIHNYHYREWDENESDFCSSGVLYQFPKYTFFHNLIARKYIDPQGGTQICTNFLDSETGEVIEELCLDVGAATFTKTGISTYLVANPQSLLPLTYSTGTPVEYSRVEITTGEFEKGGKEVLTFSTSKEHPDRFHEDYTGIYPYPPATILDWKRGLLTKSEIYKYENNSYQILQETEHEYLFHDDDDPMSNTPNQYAILGVVANCLSRGPNIYNTQCNPDDCCKEVVFSPYEILTEWFHSKQSTTRVYDQYDPNLFTETIESYSYANPDHGLMTSAAHTSSDGMVYETRYKYPQDYESPSLFDPNSNPSFHSTISVGTMLTKRMMNTPIEVQQWQGSSTGTMEITGGTITIFDDIDQSSTIVIKPVNTLILETESPLSTWVENKNGPLFQDVVPDEQQYQTRQKVGYESSGLVTDVQSIPGGKPQALIWTPYSQLVQARVTGSASENAAYTSFDVGIEPISIPGSPSNGKRLDGNWEMVGTGGWDQSDAHTGLGRYNVSENNEIKTSVKAGGTYILSFWTSTDKNLENDFDVSPGHTVLSNGERIVNGWKYYELKMDLSANQEVKIMGNQSPLTYYNWVDELRLYPIDAQMSTVCYDSSLRIHTETDANNISTYYSYDALGRLIEIRDFEGNLLQQFEYQYHTN
ncbi:MAG: RHS repeat domain-containing protein [Bacteroidota bacterium]